MMNKKLFLTLCTVLAFGAPIQTVKADGWFEFFFPFTPKGPTPEQTLRAPFADEDAVIEDLEVVGKPENATPLNLRHRTNDVMGRWVQDNVSKLLSYKAKNYNKEYSKKIKLFTDVGAKEYLKFLQNRNIVKTLSTGRYDVTGFLENYPVVINEGAVNGRYRWLFQADIMITYQDAGATQYDEENAITQEFSLTFQIGRHRNVDNEHGVLIETWNVKPK